MIDNKIWHVGRIPNFLLLALELIDSTTVSLHLNEYLIGNQKINVC